MAFRQRLTLYVKNAYINGNYAQLEKVGKKFGKYFYPLQIHRSSLCEGFGPFEYGNNIPLPTNTPVCRNFLLKLSDVSHYLEYTKSFRQCRSIWKCPITGTINYNKIYYFQLDGIEYGYYADISKNYYELLNVKPSAEFKKAIDEFDTRKTQYPDLKIIYVQCNMPQKKSNVLMH